MDVMFWCQRRPWSALVMSQYDDGADAASLSITSPPRFQAVSMIMIILPHSPRRDGGVSAGVVCGDGGTAVLSGWRRRQHRPIRLLVPRPSQHTSDCRRSGPWG
jgi:hypothetical protein